ncbi:MAG: Cys-tRNA(Pro) deacylase [Termitinemataceae bacterium]|nr:MAG: Cys-tRNA(Pro) deacylase [Termitinemataceae bacterium]
MDITTKTNVTRLLDTAHIPYSVLSYEVDENDLSGVHTAALVNFQIDQMFKTLLLRGISGAYFVCCVPVSLEIDLKKADLIAVKELLPLTGYVRGGCSPIGMKKHFLAFIDESAELYDSISISAGVRGALVVLKPQDLIKYVPMITTDIV